MFDRPSLIARIAVGKLAGLIIGLIGFFAIPYLAPGTDPLLRWGVLLWYVSLGAIIGVFGVLTWHPVLRLPTPWWFRGPLIGAWLNFVLVFFAYEPFRAFMLELLGPQTAFASPFWFVAEGAIVGLLIGYVATRVGGEGAALVADRPKG